MLKGEALLQKSCLEYLKFTYPDAFKVTYAIPNGAKRTHWESYYNKVLGMKQGVPDICIPIPSLGFHALYVEFKFNKNKLTLAQELFILHLRDNKNYVGIIYTIDEFIDLIDWYLRRNDA